MITPSTFTMQFIWSSCPLWNIGSSIRGTHAFCVVLWISTFSKKKKKNRYSRPGYRRNRVMFAVIGLHFFPEDIDRFNSATHLATAKRFIFSLGIDSFARHIRTQASTVIYRRPRFSATAFSRLKIDLKYPYRDHKFICRTSQNLRGYT